MLSSLVSGRHSCTGMGLWKVKRDKAEKIERHAKRLHNKHRAINKWMKRSKKVY